MLNPPYQLFDFVAPDLPTGGLFVEIGSDRGSGSAPYLANLARSKGADFLTIDVDPVYVGAGIKTVQLSGEDWTANVLPTLNKKISLLLLDNFDWTAAPTAVRNGTATPDVYNLIKQYAAKGLVLNNVNSSMAHLTQVLNALPYLDSTCTIMLCDTWFNYTLDTFEGKGAGAVYLLLAEGFRIISASYQSNYLLLGRGTFGSVASLPNLDLSSLNQVYPSKVIRPDAILYVNNT